MAKYLKLTSKVGYLEDTAEIEHQKFNNMRHVVLGCMLGDYDSNGNYVVNDKIIQELISLPKHIVETLENIDICESFLKLDKPISFAVTFQNDKATLSLLEKVQFGANFKLNSGTYSDVNEFILDQVETSGAVDKNAIYRMWNVKMSGGEALDIFHMDAETLARFSGIVNRFKYLLSANKLLLKKEEKIEEIESAYFNKMMEILARYPKLKKLVEQEIKTQMEEKGELLRFDKPNLMKTLNEIVTDAIEENISVLSEEEKKSFDKDKHNADNEYNLKIQDEIDIKTDKVEDKDLSLDPVIIPKIDTHNEEEIKEIETLAKEFVAEEKKTEERLQDDMTTFLTGKVVQKEDATQKADMQNLEKKEESLSIAQRSILDKNNKVANPVVSNKVRSEQTLLSIMTGKKVLMTQNGVAEIDLNFAKITKTADGKTVQEVKVSQANINVVLANNLGESTKKKIKETKALVVAPVEKANNKEIKNETVANKPITLVAAATQKKETNKTHTKTDNKVNTKKPVKKKPVKKEVDNKEKDKTKKVASTKKASYLGFVALDNRDQQSQSAEKKVVVSFRKQDIEVIGDIDKGLSGGRNNARIEKLSHNKEDSESKAEIGKGQREKVEMTSDEGIKSPSVEF